VIAPSYTTINVILLSHKTYVRVIQKNVVKAVFH